MNPSFNTTDAAQRIAVVSSIDIRIDRLCRIIENPATDPGTKILVRNKIANDINLARNSVPAIDASEDRYLNEAARASIDLAQRRAESCLQSPAESFSKDFPTHILDGASACLEFIAANAQLERHVARVANSPNPAERKAHAAAGQALAEDFIARHAITADTATIAEHPPFEKSLGQLTIQAVQQAQIGVKSLNSARRANLPFIPSDWLQRNQISGYLEEIVNEFKARSDEPVATTALVQDTDVVVIVTYEHEEAIRCKAAEEPYPPGFTATEAAQHAQAIAERAQEIAQQRDATSLLIAQQVHQAAQHVFLAAQAGVQSVQPERLKELVEAAAAAGADPAVVRDICSVAAGGNPGLAAALLQESGAPDLVSRTQAEAILQAAGEAGISEGAKVRLVNALQLDPLHLKMPQVKPLSEEAAQDLIEMAKPAGLSEEAALGLAMLLRQCAEADAVRLCAAAGWNFPNE